jgi:hypothetical protein
MILLLLRLLFLSISITIATLSDVEKQSPDTLVATASSSRSSLVVSNEGEFVISGLQINDPDEQESLEALMELKAVARNYGSEEDTLSPAAIELGAGQHTISTFPLLEAHRSSSGNVSEIINVNGSLTQLNSKVSSIGVLLPLTKRGRYGRSTIELFVNDRGSIGDGPEVGLNDSLMIAAGIEFRNDLDTIHIDQYEFNTSEDSERSESETNLLKINHKGISRRSSRQPNSITSLRSMLLVEPSSAPSSGGATIAISGNAIENLLTSSGGENVNLECIFRNSIKVSAKISASQRSITCSSPKLPSGSTDLRILIQKNMSTFFENTIENTTENTLTAKILIYDVPDVTTLVPPVISSYEGGSLLHVFTSAHLPANSLTNGLFCVFVFDEGTDADDEVLTSQRYFALTDAIPLDSRFAACSAPEVPQRLRNWSVNVSSSNVVLARFFLTLNTDAVESQIDADTFSAPFIAFIPKPVVNWQSCHPSNGPMQGGTRIECTLINSLPLSTTNDKSLSHSVWLSKYTPKCRFGPFITVSASIIEKNGTLFSCFSPPFFESDIDHLRRTNGFIKGALLLSFSANGFNWETQTSDLLLLKNDIADKEEREAGGSGLVSPLPFEFSYDPIIEISSIEPTIGIMTGGDKVFISGRFSLLSDFQHSHASCRFGDSIVHAEIISTDEIVCLSPAHDITESVVVSVSINNETDWIHAPLAFSYIASTSIVSVVPSLIFLNSSTLLTVSSNTSLLCSSIDCDIFCKFEDTSGSVVLFTASAAISNVSVVCLSPMMDQVDDVDTILSISIVDSSRTIISSSTFASLVTFQRRPIAIPSLVNDTSNTIILTLNDEISREENNTLLLACAWILHENNADMQVMTTTSVLMLSNTTCECSFPAYMRELSSQMGSVAILSMYESLVNGLDHLRSFTRPLVFRSSPIFLSVTPRSLLHASGGILSIRGKGFSTFIPQETRCFGNITNSSNFLIFGNVTVHNDTYLSCSMQPCPISMCPNDETVIFLNVFDPYYSIGPVLVSYLETQLSLPSSGSSDLSMSSVTLISHTRAGVLLFCNQCPEEHTYVCFITQGDASFSMHAERSLGNSSLLTCSNLQLTQSHSTLWLAALNYSGTNHSYFIGNAIRLPEVVLIDDEVHDSSSSSSS